MHIRLASGESLYLITAPLEKLSSEYLDPDSVPDGEEEALFKYRTIDGASTYAPPIDSESFQREISQILRTRPSRTPLHLTGFDAIMKKMELGILDRFACLFELVEQFGNGNEIREMLDRLNESAACWESAMTQLTSRLADETLRIPYYLSTDYVPVALPHAPFLPIPSMLSPVGL